MQILSVFISVVGGLAVSFLIYLGLNFIVSKTNTRWNARLLPYVFLGPVLLLIAVFLIVPTVLTVYQSLLKTDQYGLQSFGGLTNYVSLFTTGSFLQTLLNNLLWIIVVPALTVIVGLAVATLADRMGPKREKTFKSIIFLPMAISAIAASSIWKFVYYYSAPGQPQVGLLNGIWTGLTHAQPVSWLLNDTAHLNSFLLMVVVIWLNAGYAMVLLSAAIKAVPEETIEAARIDGANERQAFFRVIAPQIRTTIVAVFITVLITVMKLFDIVFAMTNGQFNTNVLGMEFYNQFFSFNNPGKASAVVVILILAVVPVIVYQVRTYREQEALR
ncbi:carbohydrate ABC transporter permease [Frondihabitans australicus]|uniref:Alpha-glucoside transport system permease protein n=1 Tax=Frondihabitans australicus TaxID=386892 RepID=A0A495IJ62_9MICO|nr:sugar ABC transporter permease [Frondihabitans australicus]RKR75331.1 alpha-glucoside transport system permease protein [Frondihabitans australicus]